MPYGHAQDDVPVARGERDEEGARDHGACRRPRGGLAAAAVGVDAAWVVEEEDERRVGQRREPGEEREAVEPRPDRVCALWERPTEVRDYLECIGAEFDDIVK